jgi:aspartyl-tRNA(Asn)/glutamyl-tRNA(Gln) amidotransferase subunit A
LAEAGEPLVGPLVGCIFSVKDNIDVAGTITTCGSRVLENSMPASEDAWIVKALKRSGAQCIGKNNMHEFALGGTGYNFRFGTTPNPWDSTRHVGGSSGGSALAVANGEVHLAIGTDSGGSVRMPASLAGIVGFKPTAGVLPMRGVVGASWSMDCLGLFTRTVSDCRVVWKAIVPAEESLLGNRPRVAYLKDFSMGRVESAVWDTYLQTIEKIRTAGFELNGISIEGLEACPYVCVSIVYPEVASAHHELLRRCPELYESDIRGLISIGELWSARMYLDAQRIRTVLRARFERLIESYDALLTPTVPVQPPKFGEKSRVEGDPPGSPLYTMIRFTVPFNVMSYPAISLPAGLDRDNLPVGLQVVGKPGRDHSLLGIAEEIERFLGPMPSSAVRTT